MEEELDARALKEGRKAGNLQSGQHISRTNHVNPNPRVRPLHSQTTRQMPYGRLGRIIRCLRLRHIDHGARHTPDEHNGARGLALHEMSSDANGEEVRAVDIDTPELAHTVGWVGDGVEVFGEAGGGNEVVDLAVIGNDLGDGGVDGVGVGNVGIVGGDFGDS